MSKIILIDYGIGNLLSVSNAIDACGGSVEVTSDEKKVKDASRVVIPGVGAFKPGMQNLNKLGLADAIRYAAEKGTPILGICLGMQLLFDSSEEFGYCDGLSLINGDIKRLPAVSLECSSPTKLPNIGWRKISLHSNLNWQRIILEHYSVNEWVYFAHSYAATGCDQNNVVAYIDFYGHKIPAIVEKENMVGCQFHPEKSGKAGLKLIKNFIER